MTPSGGRGGPRTPGRRGRQEPTPTPTPSLTGQNTTDATDAASGGTPMASVSTAVDGYKPKRRARARTGLFGIPQLTPKVASVIAGVIVAAVTVGWYANVVYAALGDLKDKLVALTVDTRGLKER